MLFSRVSAGSRIRSMGLIKGRDENQADVKGRLEDLAALSPSDFLQYETYQTSQTDGIHNLFESIPQSEGPSPLQEGKKRLRKVKVPMKGDKIHPLWYKGADPSWFESVHTDFAGRSWCLADAAQCMQAAARGFLYRKAMKSRKLQALRSLQSVYVVKLQRWWKIVSTRNVRQEQLDARLAAAKDTLGRCAKAVAARQTVGMELRKARDAALRVQRQFRSTRMKRVLVKLKEKILETACVMVQRRWRERKRWMGLLRQEESAVKHEARIVRRNFLQGMMRAGGKVGKEKESEEEGGPKLKRLGSLMNFMKNTGLLGRHKVFKEQRQDKFGDTSVEFMLKEAMNVTRDQVLALHGKKYDPHDIQLKLDEARSYNKSLLDLSGFGDKLFRWPYGLQGDHGLFAIRSLHINDNTLRGLPLDFYGLTNLTDLRAQHNRITKLLPEISRLSKIQMFWFHSNRLENLPSTIGALTDLVQLSINDNKLQAIPTSIGFLPKLRELRLDGNPLVSPPFDIVRKIVRPPLPWDVSVCLRYLRHLHNHQDSTPHVHMKGFGLLRLPPILATMDYLRELDVRNNRIEELPKFLFTLTKLRRLALDENRLERMSALVRHLSWLQDLSLTRNRIAQSGLPSPALAMLTSLQTLHMTGNLFDSPPVQVLVQAGPVIVRYLSLVQCVLNGGSSLELASFRLRSLPRCDVVPGVRRMDLRDNMLRAVPDAVLAVPRLSELLLASNILESLPPHIYKLKHLRILDVSANSLSALPDELGRLSDLVQLNLSQNSMGELQTCVQQLSSLRTLNASHNQIDALPEDLSRLSLWELDLSYNALRRLPDSFQSMTELKRLVIDGNRISDLPPSLVTFCLSMQELSASKNSLATVPPHAGKLALLHTLKLSDNAIRALPRAMAAMGSLTSLDLERNELEAVPAGVCTLPSVSTLRLKRNFLSALPVEICKLVSLTLLDASENHISSIPVELHELSNLTALHLAVNLLRVLPPTPPQCGAVLGRMEALETLDVRENQLHRLPLDLAQAPRLKHLLLHGNPWTDNPRLKRVVAPRPEDFGGELLLFIASAEGLAKMDGRKGLSDPYVTVSLQEQSFKTNVVNGSLSPVWEQSFALELDDDPSDDVVECRVLDWDLNGTDDLMGSFSIPLTPALLSACRHRRALQDGESSQVERVYDLCGTDEVGRQSQGRVRVQMEFFPLDGSLPSVQRYLDQLRQEGWVRMRDRNVAKLAAGFKQKVRPTPDGMLFEDDKDELRHRSEMREADAVSKQTRDWLWKVGQQQEPWERLEVMFTPQGASNAPWELSKSRFTVQKEDMTHFLKVKARTDALDSRKRMAQGRVETDRWDRQSLAEVQQELRALVHDDLENPQATDYLD